MPIYEYQCEECGHVVEALQRMSDPPLSDCPRCVSPGSADGNVDGGRGGTLRKMLSAHVVGSAPSKRSAGPPPSCGGCQNAGGCPMAQ